MGAQHQIPTSAPRVLAPQCVLRAVQQGNRTPLLDQAALRSECAAAAQPGWIGRDCSSIGSRDVGSPGRSVKLARALAPSARASSALGDLHG